MLKGFHDAAALRSYALQRGDGDAVLMLHGFPLPLAI